MSRKTLTIRLTGKDDITTESLIEAVQDAVLILRNIEGNMAEEGRPASRWRVEKVSLSSPLQMTISEIPPKGYAPIDPVQPFVRGMRSVNAAAETPPYFTEQALRLSKRLVALLNNGLSRIEFLTPGEPGAEPTQHLAANVDKILGRAPGFYYDDTELEGRLETLSVHDRPEFWIYDPITDCGTRCEFKTEDLDTVAELVKKRARVRVRGKVKFNREHRALSVEVAKFDQLRSQDQLPQIRDLHRARINITGGKNSVEYVRGLRDDDEA